MTSTDRLDAWLDAATDVSATEAETILGRAMILAQRAAEATLAEARAEADRIRREAQADARRLDTLLDSVRGQVAALSEELSSVEAAAASARLEVVAPSRHVVALPGPVSATVAAPSEPAPEPVPSVGERPEPAPDPPRAERPEPGPTPPQQTDMRMIGPIPVEAILPMLAIVIVLIVVLAWLG